MSNERIDVLAVMDRASGTFDGLRECMADNRSIAHSLPLLRTFSDGHMDCAKARAAVAELIRVAEASARHLKKNAKTANDAMMYIALSDALARVQGGA